MANGRPAGGKPGGKADGRAGAFTLIELLMVIVIVGFAMTIAVPMFGTAMTGGRLRTATRSIVMAGRHARSMAVLKQTPMVLEFDLGSGKLAVRSEAGTAEFARELDEVSIRELRIADEPERSEGRWGVVYQNNGTCPPYELTLADTRGRSVRVEVDALGSPRTEEQP